jgi:class 3 adenylate cyclase
MNENTSSFVHRLNENDRREIERYAASKSTSVLVLFFTDMKGSSALKQIVTEVASEQVFHSRVKEEHDKIVGEAIRRDDYGAIIKDTGDGFFAVFKEPSTAVERALEIQASFHGHPYIAVRIGMDMGQVIVQSLGGLHHDLFGRHVDWASRAMSLADGGHIIVTKAVATDAEGFINKARMRCKRHGFYIVKHSEGPIEVFEPYNANITQPMPLLHGEHVEDSISLGQSTAHAQAESTQLASGKSSNPPRLPYLMDAEAAGAREHQAPPRARSVDRRAVLAVVVALLLVAGGVTAVWYMSQRPPSPPRAVSPVQLALWDAVIAGDIEAVLAAITAGADVNLLDIRVNTAGPNGRRPLNYAAIRNDTAMIKVLLRAGAMINGTNLSGFTPLHHAGEAGSTEAAALLIARGASFTVKNRRFQTPLETAEAFRHSETAAVIRRAMDQ